MVLSLVSMDDYFGRGFVGSITKYQSLPGKENSNNNNKKLYSGSSCTDTGKYYAEKKFYRIGHWVHIQKTFKKCTFESS
jgi:hypothetical protein